MGKYYVLIELANKKYRLCRDDIQKVHQNKLVKRVKIPNFYGSTSESDRDDITNTGDDEVEFEPIQF